MLLINTFNKTRRDRPSLTALLLAAASLAFGCADDSKGDSNGGDSDAPVYLLGTRVWDDTTTTSYFNVAESLAAGTKVAPSDALEVPGAAKLYSIPGAGWFGFGGGEAPTITRYALSDSGALEEQETISLQPYGVRGLWDTLYVVSDTKMYYPDRENSQLIIINPAEMRVEGAVELPATAREGFLSLYGYTPLLRGNKLLFTVGWFDWETNDEVLAETGLVVLDTVRDTVARFDVDTRCGGITTGVTTSDGDTYFVSSALAGAANRLGRLSTSPCALRVDAKADAFDSKYLADLSELAGNSVAGEPVPALGNELFLRVFDEEPGTVTEETVTWDLTAQARWSWLRWNVETDQIEPMSGLHPSTSDVAWFDVDGRVFGTETDEEYTKTTLIELTAEGGPKEALTVQGFLHGVARVR